MTNEEVAAVMAARTPGPWKNYGRSVMAPNAEVAEVWAYMHDCAMCGGAMYGTEVTLRDALAALDAHRKEAK